MLYVAYLTFKDGLTQEQQQGGLARRATYEFPKGINHKAEYWPAGKPEVVLVFEADSFAPIFQLQLEWQDIFNIDIHPAIAADEGLKVGAQIMGQAAG